MVLPQMACLASAEDESSPYDAFFHGGRRAAVEGLQQRHTMN